jgi:K+-sensing histidine kinase KdpD
VEAHQGKVIAENRQNGGAIFTIKIPVTTFNDLKIKQFENDNTI